MFNAATVVEFDCDGKKGRTAFTLPRGRTEIVNVPLPPPGKTIQMTVHFKGDYQPYSCEFTMPELIRVPRISGIRIDGSLGHFELIQCLFPRFIAHNFIFRLFLQCAFERSSMHCKRRPLLKQTDCKKRIIRIKIIDIADKIHLRIDSELDAVSAPDSGDRKLLKMFIVRDIGGKVKILSVMRQIKLRAQILRPVISRVVNGMNDMIFGFNCVVMDDDTGSGADYWLFLKQGLAGGLRPDKFAQCILEQ